MTWICWHNIFWLFYIMWLWIHAKSIMYRRGQSPCIPLLWNTFCWSISINQWFSTGRSYRDLLPHSLPCCVSHRLWFKKPQLRPTALNHITAKLSEFHFTFTYKLELKWKWWKCCNLLIHMPFQANIFFCGNTKGHVRKKQESYSLLLQLCCSSLAV